MSPLPRKNEPRLSGRNHVLVTKPCQVLRQFGAEVAYANYHGGVRLVIEGSVRHTVLKGIYFSTLLPYVLSDLVAVRYSVSLCDAVMQCSPKCCACGPALWLRKITTDPLILAHVTLEWPDDRSQKLRIYVSKLATNAHD